MIESELKKMRASKRYAELAEQFNNLAYEQSDSLAPAAEALHTKVQQSPWISRTPAPGSPLGNERFLKAVFSEDVLKNKRNSEVVEVAPGTLIEKRAPPPSAFSAHTRPSSAFSKPRAIASPMPVPGATFCACRPR